jgi:Ca2+-transporting ATPase
MHVLFLEFIIDPACALVFEADAGSVDIMHRKPRRPGAPLFSRALLLRSTTLGFAVLIFAAAVYWVALGLTTVEQARTLAFCGLVTANLALIFVSRSRSADFATLYARPNNIFWAIAAAACVALTLSIYVAPAAALFDFSAPSIDAMFVVLGSAVIVVLSVGHLLRRQPRPF